MPPPCWWPLVLPFSCRRRLDNADKDIDVLMQAAADELMAELEQDTAMEGATDGQDAHSSEDSGTTRHLRSSTRSEPLRRTTDTSVGTTGGSAGALAARRPLVQAASDIGATRWGPSHRAIGAAVVARLTTGIPTTCSTTTSEAPPAPTRRLQQRGPQRDVEEDVQQDECGRTAVQHAVEQELAAARRQVMHVADGLSAPKPWTLRFDGPCRRNPGPGGAGAALSNPSGTVVWTC
ncbi:hypothetical protein PHMEG_00036953 [Phytophthora megakarya]|uniref:Uncharacterized protein n=1 Tax=Phytophthora megakarya TaxID=4795 RepID=A0A225UKT2_9STRA|nr:hypothetical protein PHMEG_00036953 [Phytophthora megakarya]